MIIGGFNHEDRIDSTVELFGCGDESHYLSSYPTNISLTAGVYISDSNEVMVCGGLTYSEQNSYSTELVDKCSTFKDNEWIEESFTLNRPRYAHFMESVTVDDEDQIVVYGYYYVSEVFNPQNMSWVDSLEFGMDMFSLDCVVQYNGLIYTLKNSITTTDPFTGEIQDLGELDNLYRYPGKCTLTNINGEDGILTRYGDFMNLSTLTWSQVAFPPVNPHANYPNAMFNYQGKPTIFGSVLHCFGNGTCPEDDVIQYQSETNEWISIGSMKESRTHHAVIEVPNSFCDYV